METSEHWKTVYYQKGPNDRKRTVAEHRDTGAQVFVKELPQGVHLRLQLPANLPGGFKIVQKEAYHKEEHPEKTAFERASQEGERYAAMYDHEGTWLIEGAPVLH